VNDLDQSGFGFQRARTYLGPSLGWVDTQVQPSKLINTPGTYVVQPGDSVIFVDTTGSVTIQLPDVVAWFQEPAYQPATGFARAITIKDLGNASAAPITVTPAFNQTVDGSLSSTVIAQSFSSVVFFPDNDLGGWWRQVGILGGGAGSGNMVLPVPHQTSRWISSIDVGGNALLTQPAFTDISGILQVNQGGTGLTAGNVGGIPFFNTSGSMQSTPTGPTGSVLVNGPSWSQSPVIGASGAPGSISLAASSGNKVTLFVAPLTTNWSFRLPANAGTSGQVLQTDGAGNLSWITLPITSIVVNTSVVTGGTNGSYLYDNAGIAGEKTPTQVTADLNAFTASLKGLAPPSGGGNTNFLRADGVWAVPPGAGAGGVISIDPGGNVGPNIAFVAGVGLTVTNPAPNNIQYSGILFSDIVQGDVPPSGGGTAHFLRADGTWSVPPGANITVAQTGILGGVTGTYLYDNAGVLGERTPTQVTASLDLFTTTLKGLVPPGGSPITFLRGDGTWQLAGNIAIGTTPVTGGTSGNYIFDNAGVAGEKTPAQLTADVGLFTSTLKGSVPPSGGGTLNFLRADGTWASGASVTVGDTPPASPNPGALWWDSVSGNLYIFYQDPNTSQWVIVINASTIAQATPLPTQQIFTSGSGTYTTPAGCRRIEIRLVGGGGGGSGGTPGGSGSSTTFGTLTGGFGAGGATNGFAPGGSASGGSVNINGSSGGLGAPSLAGSFGSVGGPGGTSPFGGMGCGGYNTAGGGSAAANSGSGGGGGGYTSAATVGPAGGGASGGYVEAAINAPAATYSYTVGAGGSGAAASGGYSAGGNGGSGIIIVKEYY
jgi:hypothetical protein